VGHTAEKVQATAEKVAGGAAVVLAAGGGSRFAGDAHKLLAPFRGRPLVEWAIAAALGARLAAVVVVTGAVDLRPLTAALNEQVVVVENPMWRAGQASSLRAGLDWCKEHGFDAAVIGLGDQPLVPSSAWRAVALADCTPVVTAAYGGIRRPPVRLHHSVWPLLSEGGDEGARELMRRRPDLVSQVECEGDPADIDTIEDLRRQDAGATPAAPATAE